jgi:hypothetical protein
MLAMVDPHIHWEYLLVVLKLLKSFGLIPGAVAAYFVQRWAQRRRQQKAMEGWPSVDGVVIGGKVVKQGPFNYWAEISYSYFVGEYRAGTYIRSFRRERDASNFVREMKDKRPRVHYKKSSPDVSTMLDRDVEMHASLSIGIH